MITLKINQKNYSVDAPPDMPLLWVLRDLLGLTGTKFGCGVAQCGACTVHLNGDAVRSCVTLLGRAVGQDIVTVEGLSPDSSHPLQKAWLEFDVPQCGYCQSGQLMSAAVLLKENPHPTDQDIDDAMSGNICRCGTYPRIRKAIHRAAEIQRTGVSPVMASSSSDTNNTIGHE
ncbi:MAG: (2Fe-2S)-binding protein [Chitinophagaceae bacterium]|nr:MAG: (2Fe-2S)-binding protein [Chitinophagaceae bacterium]